MEVDGRDPGVHGLIEGYNVAYGHKRQGRVAEAAEGYRSALAGVDRLQPANRAAIAAAALHQLADIADEGLTDAEFAYGERVAAATADGSEAGWTVRFALGQAAMSRDPALAMQWFDAGNGMRRAALDYSADAMDGVFDALIETFDAETIARLGAASGARSPKPVFVVGMPRSGTTLVEQILASVPGVHGAGELTAMADIARDIHGNEGDWPRGAKGLTAGRLTRLGTAYLVHLHKLAPKAERVVDKMPANAQNVGLILSLFPQATVLHVRRDPIDNCFGCYRQLFRGGVDYCYEQTELGRYHQGLMRVMDFWKQAAPGRIVDVDYTALVKNFEEEARRLVAATGMPWSDACLEFHKTERAIDTASAKQARQPLFTSGVGAAAPFRAYLRPLETALAA